MPVYEYRGNDRRGKSVKGTLDTDSLRTARIKLKKDGIYVQELRDKQKASQKVGGRLTGGNQRGVGVQDVALFTRQLASLIKANVPLVESLGAVAEQMENPTLQEVASDLKNMVNEGNALNKALHKYPKVFNNIYISMVEAGEQSGTLDVILIRLAEFTESQNDLKNKIRSAMMYPALMMLFTMGMLMILFIFVIPKIMTIFEQFPELVLPWYSQIVISISGILTNYWHVLLILMVIGIFMFRSWKATPNGSAQWDAITLKLPVVGKLARMIAVGRFTKTLSTLLAGGVPMLTALDIVKNVVDNAVLEKAVIAARDNISEGESISGPLKKSGEFPPIVIHMIAIGEKTGDLENMLTQISDSFDFQVKNSIEGLTSLMEPVMIVIMGAVVGMIVFAVMIPIFEITNIAK